MVCIRESPYSISQIFRPDMIWYQLPELCRIDAPTKPFVVDTFPIGGASVCAEARVHNPLDTETVTQYTTHVMKYHTYPCV